MLDSSDANFNVVLLDLLIRHQEYQTYDSLASKLVCPVQLICNDIDGLGALGCRFEFHPQAGVRLVDYGLNTWSDYLHWCDGRPGRHIEIYEQTSSTQDVVRRLIHSLGRSADGAVVIANDQTCGRGRLGRKWISSPGCSLLMSMARVMPGSSLGGDHLILITAMSVARAVEKLAPDLDVKIKWPNDIHVGGHKLAGILVEQFVAENGLVCAVVGVGVNVELEAGDVSSELLRLEQPLTSLKMLGQNVNRLLLAAEIIAQAEMIFQRRDDPRVLAEWKNRNTILGQSVALKCGECDVSGQVVDLDPLLGLIVRSEDGSMLHLPGQTTTVVAIHGSA